MCTHACASLFLPVIWPGGGTIMRFLVGKTTSLQLRMRLRKILIATSMTSCLHTPWQLCLTVTHLFRVTVTSSFCGLMDKIFFLFSFLFFFFGPALVISCNPPCYFDRLWKIKLQTLCDRKKNQPKTTTAAEVLVVGDYVSFFGIYFHTYDILSTNSGQAF